MCNPFNVLQDYNRSVISDVITMTRGIVSDITNGVVTMAAKNSVWLQKVLRLDEHS